VNALGPGVPEGISQAVKEVTQDERVKAAVFIGAGRILVGLDANSSLFS
jgi:enoyl-CoA hydratase/carnithine racemase